MRCEISLALTSSLGAELVAGASAADAAAAKPPCSIKHHHH